MFFQDLCCDKSRHIDTKLVHMFVYKKKRTKCTLSFFNTQQKQLLNPANTVQV